MISPMYDYKQTIFFEVAKPSTAFFIIEWIEYVSYFRKICQSLDYYIIKSLINDYYSSNESYSSRFLIRKIIENLNIFIFDIIHHDYFNNFDDMIKRFKYLQKMITDSNTFSYEKKKKFIYFLVSTLDILQEISNIFDQNRVCIFKKYICNHFSSDKIYELNFIPFAGGSLNNNKIKSFWVTDTCLSNFHFLEFVRRGGYSSKHYWSDEGFNWIFANNINKPYNWSYIDGKWYVKNLLLEDSYNLPIEKLSYYEAEACANFYNCKLPTEDEWIWMSTNRNKTSHPGGIEIPLFFELSVSFSEIDNVNSSGFKSLMGLYQLYGNVWEFTKTMKVSDKIEVCLKGGDRNVPNFILNNKLRMYIEKSNRNFNTGLRLIRN